MVKMRKGLLAMNKPFMRSWDYSALLIVVCFFAGIAAGSVWINRMSAELQAQLGVYGQIWLGNGTYTKPQAGQFFHVLIHRELAGGLFWLIGMSAFAVPGTCVLAMAGGFSGAALLSLMTLQAGILGLPVYLLSLFPHAIFYLPVVCVLLLWAIEPEKKTHVAGYVLLALLIAFGSFAECFLNPFCMRLVNLFF